MFTLFVIAVAMALIVLVLLAVAVLGTLIILAGKLAGIVCTIGFLAFGAWIILRAAKAVYNKLMR